MKLITGYNSDGFGLTAYPSREIVPYSAFGDEVTEDGEIVPKSTLRQKPECSYFARCGGCVMQHLQKSHYLEVKLGFLRKALNAQIIDIEPELVPLANYQRRRFSFRIKDGKPAMLRQNSHKTIAIKKCIIASPKINELIKNLPLFEADYINITETDNGLDLAISAFSPPDITEIVATGLVIRITHIENDKVLYQGQMPYIIAGAYKILLPPMAFLQATKSASDKIAQILLEETPSGEKMVDLYCGIGVYSFVLAKKFRKIFASDVSAQMCEAMANAVQRNSLSHVISVRQQNLARQPISSEELAGTSCAIVNPPRSGAKTQVKQLVEAGIPMIILISCDFVTFARDLAYVLSFGYSITRLVAIDQFLYSRHLEQIAVLKLIRN